MKQREMNNVDSYADDMLNKIIECVKTELSRNTPRLEGAIVTAINPDGTVDIQLPSDEGAGFSRILNQSGFELKPGDAVEVLLKNGSFTNCWITAKHQATMPVSSGTGMTTNSDQDYINNSTLTGVSANTILTSGAYLIGTSVTNVPSGAQGCMMNVTGNGEVAF